MTNHQIILHHYPQSPVSEKVRVVLGMKGLAWASVLIPRLPPKTNMMPLTGGYRLTPVMQIGADVYCDTACIIQEIERRFPEPTLFPGGDNGLMLGLARWTDGPLFQDVVTVGLVEMSPTMPPEFLADRGPLYFGPDFSLDAIKGQYTECLANIRAQFRWVDDALKGRDFLHGAAPALTDALVYYLVWFLRNRMGQGDQFLAQFERLTSWEQRIKDIGHGKPEDLADLDALEIAKNATSETAEQVDPADPLGIDAGELVSVEPAAGGVKVQGGLRHLSANHVAILRRDDLVGDVCVHFPRVGYRVKRV